MSKRTALKLLPRPQLIKRLRGTFLAPKGAAPAITFSTGGVKENPESYILTISRGGISVECLDATGRRAAEATLRQILRQYGKRLPCLRICDWPDFSRRGVMLDISRGRVPRLETLLDLVEKLAAFKINELQLYTEHTFAYSRYKSAWRTWGALTAKEIRALDARCRELGIDLVPNQNSFGHLRYLLADSRLKKLAEIAEPYESDTKDFLRWPSTLAPNHRGTMQFLRWLYDELLPNFSSRFFNVGCDETWDLGKGQSRELCDRRGKGRVYVDFLRQIHKEVASRGRTMMFWGDIILKYPQLIEELKTFGAEGKHGIPDVIALNWGYEANHPFEEETAKFAKAGIAFYVCPGTSTWQTLVGRHDNALANLRRAARAGKKFGATGFLNTEWGDGGHPQPLAVSWPMLATGAALAWNASGVDQNDVVEVLNRDVYEDSSGATGRAAMALGMVHRRLGVRAINETPLGTVIAAPRAGQRELFCRNGLKWFAKIPARKIRATLREIERWRAVIRRPRHNAEPGRMLAEELDLAARMAEQSCQYMLWQQAVRDGRRARARTLAQKGIRELRQLQKDFDAYWPLRNKGTTEHCSPFLAWRMEEYAASLRGGVGAYHLPRTSQASRKPSPKKFKAKSVATRTPPGKSTSHQ